MRMPTWKELIIREFFSFKALLLIPFFTLLYATLSVVLLNYRFIYQIFSENFQLHYKINLLLALFSGLWTTLSLNDFILFVINALLVGINCYLILKTFYSLEHDGAVKFSIGGATLIGLVTTGCTSCGLSLLSLLGLSTSFSLLPFHGLELHLVAITVLLISLVYMTKKLYAVHSCKLHSTKKLTDIS